MKKLKKILLSSFLVLILFFATSVVAQENTNEEDPVMLNGQIIATVEIYNAKITSQNENSFVIDFDFYNEVGAQTNIKYAVQLLEMNLETGDTLLIHQKNYDEIVSLSDKDTLHKQIKYTAPSYIDGNYYIGLVSENDKGIPLAASVLGEVTLEGNRNSFVEIVPGTCNVLVGENEYSADFGVDIESNEEVSVACDFKNYFDSNVDVYPVLKTYKRTLFGEMVEESKNEKSINLKKSETSSFEFLLKQPREPQSYVTVISLQDERGNVISNEESVRYVVRGSSATIQNVVFDKDQYERGEVAKLSFLITGFADNFLGARQESVGDLKNAQLELTIKSRQSTCAQMNKVVDEKDLPFVKIELEITKKCIDPMLEVVIKDKDGKMLDEGEFHIVTKDDGSSSLDYITIIFMVVVGLSLVFVVGSSLIKNNKMTQNLLILFAIGLGSFMFTTSVEAATVSGYVNNNGAETWVVASFSLNKSTYTKNEPVVMTVSSVRVITCNNNATDSHRYARIDSPPTATWVDPSLSNENTLTITSGTKIGSTMYCGDTDGDHTYITCNFGIASLSLGNATCGSHNAYFKIFAHTEKAWWAHGYIDTGTNGASYSVGCNTPVAQVSANPSSGTVGSQIFTFDGTSSDADGDTQIAYLWRLDGNGTWNSGTQLDNKVTSDTTQSLASNSFSIGTHKMTYCVLYTGGTGSWTDSSVVDCASVDFTVTPSSVDGSCGSRDAQRDGTYTYVETGYPVGSNWCQDGTSADPSPSWSYPDPGDSVTWSCDGIGGGTDDSCSATRSLSVCGDGECGSNENNNDCPGDCTSGFCPNGSCESGENTTNCPSDCTTPVCGNGTCESGESSFNCSADCPSVCPNGTCDSGETSLNCPNDCSAACGNGILEPLNGEECDDGNLDDFDGCNSTCLIEGVGGSICGDGNCESERGENFLNCAVDCPFNYREI